MSSPAITDWLIASTDLEPELVRGRAVDHLIEQRMRETGVTDTTAYMDRLRSDAAERDRVIEGIAVPETSFFRYAASFEHLAVWLRQRLVRTPPAAPLRMLSIACATGEEPCSMAITASHAGWPWPRIEIDAVDRSERWLERARSGRYAARAARRRAPDWALPWMITDDGEIHVDDCVEDRIRYRQADVLALPETRDRYDVIFCRNLLIYLRDDARRRLVRWLRAALVDDGLLFLGHADHGPPIAAEFHPAEPPGAFVFAPGAAARPDTTTPEITTTAPARRPSRTLRRPERVTAPANRNAPIPSAAREVAPPASLAAARALADGGQLDRALAMAQTVVDRDGPSASGLELLGATHLARGELRKAHDCFFRAVYLDPDHASALLQLALLSDRLGDPEQAERYRRRATRAAQHEPPTDRARP